MDNLPVEITPTPELTRAEKVAAVVALAAEIGADLLLLNNGGGVSGGRGGIIIFDAGDVFKGGALIHLRVNQPSQE